MKPQNFIIVCCCILTLPLISQQNNTLRGKILFLSSGKTPAIGVEISGSIKTIETANTVYTTNDGSYILTFPKARDGNRVNLEIGNTDENGKEIEIVNTREIEICQIPADAYNEFEIIVCRKGARDLTAQRYYKIIKTSSDVALSKIKKEMEGLLRQQEKDYLKIAEYGDKISKLEQKADSLAIYKEAIHIASINKDNASKRVLRYIQLLDEGKSIMDAREVLNIKGAANDLDQSTTLFKAAVEELEIRAGASTGIFDYDDAISCYDTIIRYSEKMGIDPLKIAQYYFKLAESSFDDGRYGKALENQEKVIAIREENLDVFHPALAKAYTSIGMTYIALGQIENALNYQQKGINIYEVIPDPEYPDLVEAYINMGNSYIHLGQYEQALEFIQKAVEMCEEIFEPNHPDLAKAYDILGVSYHYLANYDNALKYVHKALLVREDIFESNHPKLAESYNNIGQIYQALRQHKKALEYQHKGVAIYEEILDPNHLKLALSYNNISITYQNSGKPGIALDYQLKAINIQKEILEPNHPELATSYNNIGLIYQYLGEYEKALEYQQKSVVIQKEQYGEANPTLAISYLNIGNTFRILEQYTNAMDYLQKAARMMEETLGLEHPHLAAVYYHIGLTYTYLHHQQENVILYLEKSLQIFKKIDHPDQSAVLTLLTKSKANHAYGNQNYRIAVDNFLLLVKEEESSDLWNKIGICYDKLADYPKAIKALQQALAISPEIKNNYYFNNIGGVYAKNQQFDEAKDAFTEFEKLFPENARVFRNWSMYYALQNKKEEALTNIVRAIELGYDDLEWLETDVSMDYLREEKAFITILEKLKKEKK